MVVQNQSQLGEGLAILNEAVHKELGDGIGGGPRCQETMGDTIAQTRFESVSKHSNDSLLARGNTLRSDEDRLKLDELMALCTTLQNWVLDLEKTKTTQHNEIVSLKRRVKNLKDRIEQEVVEEVVGVINTAKLIIDVSQDSVATTVSSATTTTSTIKTIDDITLAQALEEMKNTKPKKKGVAKIDADHQLAERMQAQEQEELSIEEKATLFQQLLEKKNKAFALKEQKRKETNHQQKHQQIKKMCTYLKNIEGYKLKDFKLEEFNSIQEMFDRAFKRENTFEDFRTELQKVEDDKETTELKQLMKIIPNKEEVTIDAIPLAVKSPSIVGWKIHKEGRKSYYEIMRADGKSQMYRIFSHMLKSFDRQDLEYLYKLVKAKYESTRPVEDLDLLL
ncbi:hypothetical protein Tco_0298316 [Tanacetum coccineum]